MSEFWRERRDAKLAKILDPDEAAWLVAEEIIPEKELVIFSVVHRWPFSGWATRQFSYDTVSNVFHFRGSTLLADGDLVKMKAEQRIYSHHTVE